MVSIIPSVAAAQNPAGSFVVMVSVTLPEVKSADDGVYMGLSNVLLLNVPEPDDDQETDVALPPIEPDKV